MTDEGGSSRHAGSLAHVLNTGRTAAEQPLPWLIAAMVFFTNAVLTATQRNWWLAALEFATCLLAVLSAASVAKRALDRATTRPPEPAAKVASQSK
jgi:hypothetical protein